MMTSSGFITIDRDIRNWGWYTDIKTFKLFFHMMLCANYSNTAYRGITVRRGQIIKSLNDLSEESGLTRNEVRTALKHLEDSGEITKDTVHSFTVYTLANYDTYLKQGYCGTMAQEDHTEKKTENPTENPHNSHTDNTQSTQTSHTDNTDSTQTSHAYNNKYNKNKKDNKKEKRKPYGSYENVYLSDEEYEDLKESFFEYEEMIDQLSCKIVCGAHYSSHYKAILTMAEKKWTKPRSECSYDLEEFYKVAVADSMRDD